MVFFSCNACGQSVKKNQVEKHYQIQCRKCEVLSCVDCGKEFKGDDYKGHTKCISEEEKYGGKDFKQTHSVNKGEVKQDKWIENIQSTIASAEVRRPIFDLLKRLLTFSNIPRKQGKFEKFLENSLKVYDRRLVSEIWDVVNVGNSGKSGQEELPRKTGEDDVTNRQIELASEQENCIGEKRRKSKTPEAKSEICGNCKGEGCGNCEEKYKPNELEHEQSSPIKKKKKHKRKKEASDDENDLETTQPIERGNTGEECSEGKHKDHESEHCSEVKKKKKRKPKKGTALDEENTVGELEGKMDISESTCNASIGEQQTYNGSGCEEISSVAKKKKKHKREKRKACDEENGIDVDENMGAEDKGCISSEVYPNELESEQINSATKKKKKHKRKNELREEEKHSEENCDTQVVLHGAPEMKKRKKHKMADSQAEFE